MNCKDCQELLLSDYIDGELAGLQKDGVDAHLSTCAECRLLMEKVKADLVAPFRNLECTRPPEQVWQNIKDEITANQEEIVQPQRLGFWEGLAGFRFPAFTLGIAAVLLIAVAVSKKPVATQTVQVEGVQIEEFQQEVSYIALILEPAGADEEGDGYGTAIEEYFL